MMSKKALTDALVANGSFRTRDDAEHAVDSVMDALASTVRGGTPVTIRNFGRFIMKDRKARTGRNPGTGEAIEIAAKSQIAFKAH